MLEAVSVYKSYGEKRVLCGASIKADGNSIALMGASGSGKTTMLRILSRLENADSGDVITSGKTAVVFAEPRLFDVAALENVCCVMDRAIPKPEKEILAKEILEKMGLADALDLRPSELSSGMAARVSLARAIAFDAENYLLDEPFRALDGETSEKVKKYVFDTLKDKSVIMVTHDDDDARLCDAVMTIREGVIAP